MPYRDNVWYPYIQMSDWSKYGNKKIFYSGEGFCFLDKKGERYLDGISNMWCNVWGFSKNRISDEMINQIRKIPHSTIFGVGNEKSIELSNRFLKIAKGMHKVFFTDNGSSSVEVALKIAIQYWKNKNILTKNSFLSLQDGYHGDTFGAMSVGFVDKYFHSYKDMLFNCIYIPKPHNYNIRTTEYEMETILMEETEKIISENADKTNALIMESGAQIAGGITIYQEDYQKKIMKLCRKYNILFILDEIATGFGRLGSMIEYLSQDTIPDIVCFGKAITGGYFPLAMTLASKKIYDEFEGSYTENKHLFHGHTFAGHPVGCTAVIENLKLYRQKRLLEKIKTNSRILHKRLKEFERFSIVKNIRSKGMLGGFDLVKNNRPINFMRSLPINYYIMNEALKKKVLLRSLGNTIIVVPPLAIDRESLNKIIDTQYDIVKNIQKNI